MPRQIPPLSAALTHLRLARGWERPELARAAGIVPQAISAFERGEGKTLRLPRLVELAALMGYSQAEVEVAVFFHGFLSGSDWDEGRDTSPLAPSAFELRRASEIAARIALAEAVQRRAEMLGLARARRIQRARDAAARDWAALLGQSPEAQRQVIEATPRLHTWAMAEHLCNQSVRAAANDPPAALRLARLALRVAELVPAEEGWKGRLAGYTWAFIANAERVSSDLPAAESSLATAWKLWSGGEAAGETPFGEWRLHDLEASLRRAQRRFEAALACLERALASAPAAAVPSILLKKQHTFEQAGDVEAALCVLEEAAPHLEAAPDARLRWGFEFNATSMLCHAGRYQEAEARLPALFRYSAELDKPLDNARVVWLSGRIAVGCGRRADALAAFEKAQHTFSVHRIAFDAALVSLDLAIIHIEEGRMAEVARLAEDMLAVFSAQRVQREALAAVSLFCEAARQGAATVELVQRVRDYLERARRNPRLRFTPR